MFFYDSDEDSDDVFFRSAYSRSPRKEPACSEDHCEGEAILICLEPAQEHSEEPAISRVVRLWNQHVEQQGGKPDLSDRLAAAAEYRRWVKETDVGLEPDETMPSFTQLWAELNKQAAVTEKGQTSTIAKDSEASEAPEASEASENAKPSSSAERGKRYDNWYNWKPRWHSAQETLQLLLDSLRSLEASMWGRPIKAGKLSHMMRERSSDFSIQKTPFRKFGELLQLAAQDGWIRLTWSGHNMTVQIQELPTDGVSRVVDTWERQEDVGIHLRPAKPPVVREVRQTDTRDYHFALKPAPDADPYADSAAEGSLTYLRQRNVAMMSASERGKMRPVTPERPPRSKAMLAPSTRATVNYPYRVLTRRDEHRPERERSIPLKRRRSRSRSLRRQVSSKQSRGVSPGRGRYERRERSRDTQGQLPRRMRDISRSRARENDQARKQASIKAAASKAAPKKKASRIEAREVNSRLPVKKSIKKDDTQPVVAGKAKSKAVKKNPVRETKKEESSSEYEYYSYSSDNEDENSNNNNKSDDDSSSSSESNETSDE